jgi:cobalt-zinc-cadmium efflux system membrane fusion protein
MKFSFFSIFILIFTACSSTPNPEVATPQASTETMPMRVEMTAAQLKNAQLEIGSPERRKLGNTIKVNGFMEAPPQNIISISCPLGGYLKQTKLLPGLKVRRGEVLATLEDPQYITLQQEYLATKARLEYLSADLARQETLNRDQSSSDKVLQLARSEYQTQQINAKALGEKLKLIGINPERLTVDAISKNIQIYAPIDGFVAAVKVNIGKYVAPTDVLFELVNTDDIHLTLNVFEQDLAGLAIGQKVMAYANADPNTVYPAKIILISQNIGEDRSVTVHCHLDQKNKVLLPGMFMTAMVETQNENAITLPNDAILRFENAHYVFVAQSEGVFEMVAVEKGTEENGFTALVSANAASLLSQKIVLKNAYTLLMKMKNAAEE